MGDMAWAESPRHKIPVSCQRRTRSTLTVNNLILFQSSSSMTRSEKKEQEHEPLLKFSQPLLFDFVKCPFADDEAALPVIAALQQDQQGAGVGAPKRLLRVVCAARNSHPQNVHRVRRSQ